MRVLFASTRLSGGAGIACRRIWESFREQNRVDLATLVYRDNANLWIKQYDRAKGETLSQEIYKHHSQWADEQNSKQLNEERSSFSATYLSALELEGAYDPCLIELFDAHDIVNIHWTAGLITIKSLRHLADTCKPVIITMHDQNYITGACHYSAGCRLFTNLCTGCPQLQTERAQLFAEQQHIYKRSILGSPNFFWTGPSEWIVKEAAKSGIPFSARNLLAALKNPAIDDAVCAPGEVASITQSLQSGKRKVALVADDLNDPRKGILIGAHAIAMAMSTSNSVKEGIELHMIGSADGIKEIISELVKQSTNHPLLDTSINVVSHGRVPSHHLAVILQMVDLLVFPSIEENYSNLLVEALVAGTRIAAFAIGGNSEIAQSYPELMHVVGDRLNITNGMNGNDNSRLRRGVELLAQLIQHQLAANRDTGSENDAAARCKQNHSRDSVARDYFLAMIGVLEAYQTIRTFDCTSTQKNQPSRRFQAWHYRRQNRQHVVNCGEPVFWLSSKNDWPLKLGEEQLLLTLMLKPSWDADFISNRVDTERWSISETPLFTHDQHHIPKLQYWDCVALLSTSAAQDRPVLSGLLRRMDEEDNGIPILLQVIVRIPKDDCTPWNTFSDVLWQYLLGESIVPPMQGFSIFPKTIPFADPIDVHKAIQPRSNPRARITLSSIRQHRFNTEEPVYWLGRDTFNDLTHDSEYVLIAHGLYPSWETDYLKKTIYNEADVEILHEIPHMQSYLPQLRYWNTVVISIAMPGDCHLFSEEADEVHALPILYMGYGESASIKQDFSLSGIKSIHEALTTLIPPMDGLRHIYSSLR